MHITDDKTKLNAIHEHQIIAFLWALMQNTENGEDFLLGLPLKIHEIHVTVIYNWSV